MSITLKISDGEMASIAVESAVVGETEITARVQGGGVLALRLAPGAIAAAKRDKAEPPEWLTIIAVAKASDAWSTDAFDRDIDYWLQRHGATTADFRRIVGETAGSRGPLWSYHDKNRNRRAARQSAVVRRKKARTSA